MKTTKVPFWIVLFGGFLAVVGLGAGITAVVDPTKFFSDYSLAVPWSEISAITAGHGVRSLGGAVAMIVALWSRQPGAIAAVFSMRFLTELGDLLLVLSTGHGPQVPAPILIAAWVILFLVPEAIAARWGFSSMCCRRSASQE